MTQPNPLTTQPEALGADKPAKASAALPGMILRIVLPIFFLGLGAYFYSQLSIEVEEEKEAEAAEKVIRTSVTRLHVTDHPVVIRSNGIVQPHNEVTLSAEVSGQITFVSPSFEAGSYFSEGDVLVALDDRDYVTSVAVAEAQQKSAESGLALAEQNHDRNLRLYENKVVSISEAEVNQSDAMRSQAAAQLDTAIAAVEQAKRDLERTKIVAPFDGRVRQKAVGLGQTVGPGTALGIAFAVDYAEVRFPISARELQFLDLPELPGDATVEVQLRDAINEANETVWKGTIVRTEGTLDVDSLAVFAVARVDDPFGRTSSHPPLRIGQPVIGSIIGDTLSDVVVLPRAAVRQLDQVVLVDEAELTLSQLTIEAIWSDEDSIYVRNPLIQDGSLLATTQLVYVPEGAKVEIIPDIDLTATTAQAGKAAQASNAVSARKVNQKKAAN